MLGWDGICPLSYSADIDKWLYNIDVYERALQRDVEYNSADFRA